MFASCKEAFIASAATALDMAGVSGSGVEFYRRHLKTYGNAYVLDDLRAEVTKEWAKAVAEDALAMLKGSQ